MSKIYFLVFAFICLTSSVTTGQAPAFVWAQQGVNEPTASNATAFMVTDTAGNSYVGGVFGSDSIRFGNFLLTLPTGSFECLYVVKYTPQGQVVWAQQCYGLTYSQCNAVTLDAATGKLYIAAFYGTSGSGSFGSYTFSTCSNCCLVAQLDAATGTVGWVSTMLGSNNWVDLYSYSIAVSSNRVYVTGLYQFYGSGLTGSMILGNGITLYPSLSTDDNNVFIAQYDFNGNALWGKLGTGYYSMPYSTGVITDKVGNPYIAGVFTGSLVFGNDSLPNGTHSFYLAKYDTMGNFLWVQTTSSKNTNGNGYNAITGIAKDGDGNIYLTGYFVDTLFFPPNYTISIAAANGNYVDFVAKYDANGNTLWAKNLGATWGATVPTPAIAVDADNNFYLTGTYQVPIQIGPDSLTPYGPDSVNGEPYYYEDILVAKYDSMGNPIWAKSAGGDWVDWGTGIGVDAHGNEYISGIVTSDTSYFDNIVQYSPGGCGIIVAKLGGITVVPPPVTQFSASADTVCSGSPVTFTNLSTGSPTAILWTLSGGSPDTSTSQNPTIVYNDSGTYAVKLVVSNSGGTDSLARIAYITVLPLPVPVVGATDSLICSGDSTQICASGGSNYIWNTTETSACIFASNAGAYWVTATGTDGCTAISGHQNISVYPVPSVSIIVQGDTLNSYDAVSYQWYLNGDSIPNANDPIYIAVQPGNYSVGVRDTNGCRALSNSTYIDITGIAGVNGPGTLNIYPNPVTGTFYITWDDAPMSITGIEVYNVLGKIVLNKEASDYYTSPTSVDASALPDGMYFVIARTTNTECVEKIVKQ